MPSVLFLAVSIQVQSHCDMEREGEKVILYSRESGKEKERERNKITSVCLKHRLGLNFPDFYQQSLRNCLSRVGSGAKKNPFIYMGHQSPYSVHMDICMATLLIDTFLPR